MIIHAGGNNINDHTIRNPQFLSNAIITTLENIRRRMPRTQIYYSAILPRTTDSYLPMIFLINREIRKYCFSKGIYFISNHQFTRQRKFKIWTRYEINATLISNDLTHPTPAGTRTLARNFIDTYRTTQPTFRVPQRYRHHPSRRAQHQNPTSNNQFRDNTQHQNPPSNNQFRGNTQRYNANH